jgi:hypothetical protein
VLLSTLLVLASPVIGTSRGSIAVSTVATVSAVVGVLAPAVTGAVYDGRRGETHVRVPRLEGDVQVDGALDEPVWHQAALLTGFSQYAPIDGIPAADSTEVLVWYSAAAIYFGIRAFEAHGRVHATLADRDHIDGDDNVQLYLGTFDDGRQAAVIGVNPLGIQSDGTLVENGKLQGGGFSSALAVRETPDLSPDFVYQSKGRVTSAGYEVEVRIPFKSLRYQPRAEQRWGLQIVRHVQHSGAEDTWTPAKRAAASFLAQAGSLEGLVDLHRGLVLDLNPEATTRLNGDSAVGGGWRYRTAPALGGNVRWGVTNNLSLNGTINPDFSQVEADAGQFTYDPRQAIFFSEKRPFFLDGIEQFDTPNQLIYTRTIVQPVVAAKVTGKLSGTDLALLSAVDDRPRLGSGALATRDYPVINILRVQRDVGASSRVGIAYTDRVVGGDYNRVADADARFVFGSVYSAQLQLAESRTRRAPGPPGTPGAITAPLWDARFIRKGRTLGIRYVLTGIHPDFEAQSGFIGRRGIVNGTVDHSITLYGSPSSLVQSIAPEVSLSGTWQYDAFVRGRTAEDKRLHFIVNSTLRGGWTAGTQLLVESYGYDSTFYGQYRLARPRAGGAGADTLPFVGTPHIPNLDYVASLNTPAFRHFSGSAVLIWGRDENFFEWAPANIYDGTLTLTVRPTDQLRLDGTYQHQQFDRRSNGSTVGIRRLPRLKIEYQLTRSVFVRVVGEYDASRQDSLRDDSRTGLPILVYDPVSGTYLRAGATASNRLRADWLFSYQPTPGTVLFAGYSSLRAEPDAFRFTDLRRQSDGFFVKLSYLFRM